MHTGRAGMGSVLNMASQFTTVPIIVPDRKDKMKKTLKLAMDLPAWWYSVIGPCKRQNKGFTS